MKTRLLSALLIFLLVASGSVPAVSAQLAPAAPVGGLAYDVIKEVLNPVTEQIPFFLKNHQITQLKQNREQAINDLSIYSNSLPAIQRKCIENIEKIKRERKEITENQDLLRQIRDNTEIKNRIKKNINDCNFVLSRIEELKTQIVKFDALIEKEEERYQIMVQDAMKGHEIMQYIKDIEDDYDVLYSVLEKVVSENETLLKELQRH